MEPQGRRLCSSPPRRLSLITVTVIVMVMVRTRISLRARVPRRCCALFSAHQGLLSVGRSYNAVVQA